MLHLCKVKSVHQIRTNNCQKKGQPAIQFPFIFIITIISLYSCGSFQDPAHRPSPLVADSISTDTHSLSIAYSSPRVRQRKIWNSLVPFHKVWRTGANEATVFETTRDLIINNQRLPKGKYAVFTIPSEDNWTIIFNREWDQWGAYGYDESKDQLRIEIKPEENYTHQEEMTFKLTDRSIEFRWETMGYQLPYRLAN